MLSNRTYLGIKDAFLETDALRECAALRASNRSRAHTRRSDRAFFQLAQDKRALTLAYKKLREHFEAGGEFSPTADLFCDNFYIVEKNIIALMNSVSDIKAMKLPVCADGDSMFLPVVYSIAVDMVGHRDGRIDEAVIEQYMEAYQSVTPLSVRETAALVYMIKTALIKLIKIESDECLNSMRAVKKAETIAQFLIRYRDDMGKQQYQLNKIQLEKEGALIDCLVHHLADNNEYVLLERLYSNLETLDIDAESLISGSRRMKTRSAMLMMNAINSLRLLDAIDTEALFERICRVEHELLKDKTYGEMDKKSRAYYRSCVERIAHSLKASETSVAKKALALAATGEEEKGQVGYYLFLDGKKELYKSIRPDKQYREYSHGQKLWTITVAQIAILIPLLVFAAMGGIIPCLLSIFPAWTIANFIVVRIAVKNSTPKIVPRLSLEEKIGEENRTLVVVPTLVCDDESLEEAIENIETHYLSNPLDNCYFAILSDFCDSEKSVNEGEEALLVKAKSLIKRLNEKYAGENQDIFYFLHRGRQYLISDDVYMGHERKRGALMALAEYIVTGVSTQFVLITSPLPENIKYCLTLDSDTVLNKETLSELIGAAAHPLNKPVLDENGVVIKGYGVIVPKMRTLASSANKSRFARLFSVDAGFDIYATASSEFYQDIFKEGIFGGKGIFTIDVFYSSLKRWIRDNAVLSHDLLEGSFLRAGYMGDVTLYDSTPNTFISWWKRSHRWIRGDWQLLPYLWFNIKDADGAWKKNPLSVLSRYKMLENIRRTMLCSGILYTFIVMPYIGFGFYTVIALTAFLEDAAIDLVEYLIALLYSKRERYNAGGLFKERINTLKRSVVSLATLPYETSVTSDAMSRALYRMFISHKKLLEWQTASQSGGKKLTLFEYYKKLYVCLIAGIVMAVSVFLGETPLLSTVLSLLFLLAPLLVSYIDKSDSEAELDAESEEFLKLTARSTWRFFATFCNEKTAYLPPDNYQAMPEKLPTMHTSPTNIGMGLMAVLSAFDMGFIGRDEFLLRIKRMLVSIENAPKWHGHLYNWYKLPTLTILPVKYVSTVDSGNLAAALLTIEQALYEQNAYALASISGALARNMDFTYLYDKSRSQFHIGYDAESNELSKSWYDLLASEARLTTIVAIALGQVKMKSYYSLSRLLVPSDGGRSLISWSGTMFEYLMPVLFTGTVKGTLMHETCVNAVKTQINYTRDIWGISESGYYAFDKARYYQYRAFGVPKLSLMPTHEKETVIAPYASALALMVDKRAAVKNLMRLSKLGMLSKYGMYEALDMSKSRIQGESPEKVASFMAHHQGMTLCAVNNIFSKNNITTRFLKVPEIRSVKMLFEEKRPSMAIIIKDFESSVYKNNENTAGKEYKPRCVVWGKDGDRELKNVQTQVLSNGEYTVLIGDDSSGYSKCNNHMLNRFRNELKENSGIKFCIRNDNKVVTMSSADNIIPDSGETVLEPHGVKFSRRDKDMDLRLNVSVAPDHNAEIRKLTIANRSNEDMEIEVGIFFDVALATIKEELSHSAFVKVRTDCEFEDGTMLYFRRKKNSAEDDGCFMHCRVISDNSDAKIKYCSDRLVMPGRGRSEKEAMMIPILQEKSFEAPVEVGFCARITLNVKAESVSNVSLVMGFAKSKKQALSDSQEICQNVDNIMGFAWTYAKNTMRFEGITKGKADIFEKAVSCLYAYNAHKTHAILNCEGGIDKLWRLGVSGDKPIILMTFSKITQSRMVKTLLEFMSYINSRGIEADMVFIGDYPHEYSNEKKRRLEEMVSTYARLSNNVHILHGYELSQNDKKLLVALATMEIDSSISLDKQFLLANSKEDSEKNETRKIYPLFGVKKGAFANKRKELEFYNGFGGFSAEDCEYIIYKNGENAVPMPWCNILANEKFGTVISENGGGFTWHKNSRLNKLTQQDPDPLSDIASEEILICDNENASVWTVCENKSSNEAHHGIGYSRFISNEEEIKAELTVFVDSEKSVKYSVLTLTNPMMNKRKLSLMYNIDWCLGEFSHPEAVQTEYENGIMFLRSLRNNDENGFAYMAIANVDGEIEYSGDKEHIKNGAIHLEHLNKKVGLGLGGVGALRTDITLKGGEKKTVIFIMGEDEKENARQIFKSCDIAYINERKAALDAVWNERLTKLQVKTQDRAMDIMLNKALLYQVYSSRLLGKTGYYQCGGATGFRDQLQDMLSLKLTAPEKLREHIIKCASKQFEAGDVLHWWHDGNLGIRTRCSDDRLFLPYAVCEYIKTTKDESILDEKAVYLKDVELLNNESIYCRMTENVETESIYEHCVRAIKSALNFGKHSLLLMGSCDWNDSMDEVGKEDGESVWLSMFLVYILERFYKLSLIKKDVKNADEFLKARKKLKEAIENEGWDGAWYRRAYLGDSTPIGSYINDECSIDLISQAWAVFIGAKHAKEAYESAEAMLVDSENGIIKLLAPPFDKTSANIGYIEEYLSGVRENGGQYTHAAAWFTIAACMQGQNYDAHRYFSMLNPINHSSDLSGAMRYKTEPYALCGDVYSVGKNAGRGGWSHYTGAAGWLYTAGIEHILGIQKEGDELLIKPNTVFDEFSFEYKHKDAVYRIKIVRASDAQSSEIIKLDKESGEYDSVVKIAY